jgi:prolyl oligopeptidase
MAAGAFFVIRTVLGITALSLAMPVIAEEPLAYPDTATVPVIEVAFGEAVQDPYRWLEADVRTDTRVSAWVAAQNAVSSAYLSKLPGRETFAARIGALMNFERMSTPQYRVAESIDLVGS